MALGSTTWRRARAGEDVFGDAVRVLGSALDLAERTPVAGVDAVLEEPAATLADVEAVLVRRTPPVAR
jgi:hypothetical protein